MLPVFMSHEGMAATWQAAGKQGPPPTKLTCIDLRILIAHMRKPFKETGVDWSIVRFLGTEEVCPDLSRPHPTSPDLTRPRPTSPDLARPHPTSPDLTRPRLTCIVAGMEDCRTGA